MALLLLRGSLYVGLAEIYIFAGTGAVVTEPEPGLFYQLNANAIYL